MKDAREQMIRQMKLRNLSPATQERYLWILQHLEEQAGKPLEKIRLTQVRDYLLHLHETCGLAPSTINARARCLRFFFLTVLGRTWPRECIPNAREPKRLPVVLSPAEVVHFFDTVESFKYRVIFMLMYAAGLRVSEAARLQAVHIDSQRMVIRVEQGKMSKDRYVMLSRDLLGILRQYWKMRPTFKNDAQKYLFPGDHPQEHIATSSIGIVCKKTLAKSGLKKAVTPHTFRHCFATHLLEAGVDLRTIQVLMGHASFSSTARYTHLATASIARMKSPFDSLPRPEGR